MSTKLPVSRDDQERDLLDDQEPVLFDGDDDGWTIIPSPIADGSQVLAHDGYDVQIVREACRDFSRLQALVDDWSRRVFTAPALIRDLFWTFYKRAPRIEPVVPITQAYDYNRVILQQVLTTTEYQSLYAAGTADDPLHAAMATIGVANRALGALDAATIDAINRLAEHESGAAALFEQAEALESLAEQEGGDRAQSLIEQAQALREEAEAEAQTADAAAAELAAQDVEAVEDAVRQAARDALRQAEAMIDTTTASVKAFTGGYDRSEHVDGVGRGLSTREKIALAGQVQRSPRLKQLAAMAGRFTRIALKVQENKTDQLPTEVTNIVRGDDLRRMLPIEYLSMTDPDMADWWAMRYLSNNLTQYELVGREKQGQGPIILAIDSSGSMAGQKEIWSKAIFLALLAIARLQRRDLACIHFSDSLKLWHFPKGAAAYPEVLASCEYFIGGGTPFEPWMEQALRLIDDARYSKADVICLSDGLASIDPSMQKAWNQRRHHREMRCYAVLIGTRQGAGVLGHISDAVLTIDDLAADGAVLDTVFAV